MNIRETKNFKITFYSDDDTNPIKR